WETDDDEAEDISLEEGFYAALQNRDQAGQPAAQHDEFFDQWGGDSTEMPPEDEFFEALGMIGDQPPTDDQSAEWDAGEMPPEDEFFEALGMIGDQPPDQFEVAPTYGDVDSYLASLHTPDEPAVTPSTGAMFDAPENVDLDTLFDQPVM